MSCADAEVGARATASARRLASPSGRSNSLTARRDASESYIDPEICSTIAAPNMILMRLYVNGGDLQGFGYKIQIYLSRLLSTVARTPLVP